jgi:hypothetical protein
LESIGLERQRLQMVYLSAAMAGEFAFSAAEITAEIRRMGPNPLRMNGARPQQGSEGLAEQLLGGEDADNS